MIYIFPLDYRGKTSETHGAGSFGLGEETALWSESVAAGSLWSFTNHGESTMAGWQIHAIIPYTSW